MNVQEDIPLAPLTTFRLGPRTRYFIELTNKEDVPGAFAFIKDKGLPFFVLGGGSNTIFTIPERFEGVVLKIGIPGFEVIEESDTTATVRVGAGEDWDQVVARTVERGLSGIEAMSAIPGLAGATPIQNVGAYGSEIADTLQGVEAYEFASGAWKILNPEDCGFSYRDSVFKHEKRYLITSIILKLSKGKPAVPDYPGVKAYFDERGITEPTLADIRAAIIEIRKTKLPDPKDIASVGSFFKNPIVSREAVDRLRIEFEKPIVFELSDGRYKVGAGWLIDTLGLKGQVFGNLSVYPHNALVIVNNGEATYPELAELIRNIQAKVEEQFGITLEPEPIFF